MSLHPPRRTPDDEIRLIMLYAIRHLPPCTGLQLQQVLFECNEMNYFDMMIALNELCANGQANREKKDNDYTYSITPAGEEVLSLFGNRVPASIRQYIEEHEADIRQKFLDQEHYPTVIRKMKNGEYLVCMSVVEPSGVPIQLILSAPTYACAAEFASNWPKKAPSLYGHTVIGLSDLAEELQK